jgi:mRNA-degrading endonuclease toxin of MazEF toxin-antitoxin module
MENNELKNKAIELKNKSLKRLNSSFLTHINFNEYKQTHLLAYWINDFAMYHDNERKFDVSKSGRFLRGSVINVNFGYNVGNEFGGLHYCVVLNKNDNLKNGTLNVLPLTSKKNGKKYPNSCVNLGTELYDKLNDNHLQTSNSKESIGLIHQITTISKQRIFNEPKLYKFRISNEKLDLIDKKIIEFFTKY